MLTLDASTPATLDRGHPVYDGLYLTLAPDATACRSRRSTIGCVARPAG
jgi:hypothetical protein